MIIRIPQLNIGKEKAETISSAIPFILSLLNNPTLKIKSTKTGFSSVEGQIYGGEIEIKGKPKTTDILTALAIYEKYPFVEYGPIK